MDMNKFISVSADFECHIFPDTFCFSCGLCNWVRQEKENYKEWLKTYEEHEEDKKYDIKEYKQ